MYSLHTTCRIMLIGWLCVVFVFAVILLQSRSSTSLNNMVHMLFSNKKEAVVLPAPLPEPAKIEQRPIIPAQEIKEPPESEWLALKTGTKKGQSKLEKPEIEVIDHGELAVSFNCAAPGEYRAFWTENVDARYVDLFGAIGQGIHIDQRLSKGVLKRIQIADHKEFVRVSGIARDQKSKINTKVEYSAKRKVLRIIFFKE